MSHLRSPSPDKNACRGMAPLGCDGYPYELARSLGKLGAGNKVSAVELTSDGQKPLMYPSEKQLIMEMFLECRHEKSWKERVLSRLKAHDDLEIRDKYSNFNDLAARKSVGDFISKVRRGLHKSANDNFPSLARQVQMTMTSAGSSLSSANGRPESLNRHRFPPPVPLTHIKKEERREERAGAGEVGPGRGWKSNKDRGYYHREYDGSAPPATGSHTMGRYGSSDRPLSVGGFESGRHGGKLSSSSSGFSRGFSGKRADTWARRQGIGASNGTSGKGGIGRGGGIRKGLWSVRPNRRFMKPGRAQRPRHDSNCEDDQENHNGNHGNDGHGDSNGAAEMTVKTEGTDCDMEESRQQMSASGLDSVAMAAGSESIEWEDMEREKGGERSRGQVDWDEEEEEAGMGPAHFNERRTPIGRDIERRNVIGDEGVLPANYHDLPQAGSSTVPIGGYSRGTALSSVRPAKRFIKLSGVEQTLILGRFTFCVVNQFGKTWKDNVLLYLQAQLRLGGRVAAYVEFDYVRSERAKSVKRISEFVNNLFYKNRYKALRLRNSAMIATIERLLVKKSLVDMVATSASDGSNFMERHVSSGFAANENDDDNSEQARSDRDTIGRLLEMFSRPIPDENADMIDFGGEEGSGALLFGGEESLGDSGMSFIELNGRAESRDRLIPSSIGADRRGEDVGEAEAVNLPIFPGQEDLDIDHILGSEEEDGRKGSEGAATPAVRGSNHEMADRRWEGQRSTDKEERIGGADFTNGDEEKEGEDEGQGHPRNTIETSESGQVHYPRNGEDDGALRIVRESPILAAEDSRDQRRPGSRLSVDVSTPSPGSALPPPLSSSGGVNSWMNKLEAVTQKLTAAAHKRRSTSSSIPTTSPLNLASEINLLEATHGDNMADGINNNGDDRDHSGKVDESAIGTIEMPADFRRPVRSTNPRETMATSMAPPALLHTTSKRKMFESSRRPVNDWKRLCSEGGEGRPLLRNTPTSVGTDHRHANHHHPHGQQQLKGRNSMGLSPPVHPHQTTRQSMSPESIVTPESLMATSCRGLLAAQPFGAFGVGLPSPLGHVGGLGGPPPLFGSTPLPASMITGSGGDRGKSVGRLIPGVSDLGPGYHHDRYDNPINDSGYLVTRARPNSRGNASLMRNMEGGNIPRPSSRPSSASSTGRPSQGQGHNQTHQGHSRTSFMKGSEKACGSHPGGNPGGGKSRVSLPSYYGSEERGSIISPGVVTGERSFAEDSYPRQHGVPVHYQFGRPDAAFTESTAPFLSRPLSRDGGNPAPSWRSNEAPPSHKHGERPPTNLNRPSNGNRADAFNLGRGNQGSNSLHPGLEDALKLAQIEAAKAQTAFYAQMSGFVERMHGKVEAAVDKYLAS